MVTDDKNTKKTITVHEFSDLSGDCLLSVLNKATATFFLGGIGIRLFLVPVNKVIGTHTASNFLATLCGSVALAIFVADRERRKCEKKIDQMYTISRQ